MVAAVAVFLTGCCLLFVSFRAGTRKRQVPTYHMLKGRAQGTTYFIQYAAERPELDSATAAGILAEIDRSLSLYLPASLINAFNRSARGVRPDTHMFRVVRKSIGIFRESGGAFDITVRPLLACWGFGPDPLPGMPTAGDIKRIMAHVGTDKLLMNGDSLCKLDPRLEIDCNGIAQGYTVDVLADQLEARGVSHYLVELGGEIRMSGVNPEGLPWRVGVEGPAVDDEGDHILSRIVRPGKAAITTSGSYRRTIQRGGKTYSHIIDPATGYPADNGMISATVIAADAMTADAWDNVCMVMGPDRSMKLIQGMKGMEAYLVYRGADGIIRDTATAGFMLLSDRAE